MLVLHSMIDSYWSVNKKVRHKGTNNYLHFLKKRAKKRSVSHSTYRPFLSYCADRGGIRTPDTLLTYTRFPGDFQFILC